MGRIEEALRRSSAAAEGSANADTVVPSTPRTDTFESPWSFPDAESAAKSPRIEKIGGSSGATSDPVASEPAAVFRGFSPAFEQLLVVGRGAPPLLAEQFRRLAATLHQAQLAAGTKVIMVTSASPADGKSLTSANLALTLSESYRRQVLLIDADLRRPSLHHIFAVPNVSGLNDGLQSGQDHKLTTLGITANLTLLPAGRPDPDPMSGLTSSRMRDILHEASQRFDWVIVDTAPVGLLADASIVGAMVDGALLVIRAGRTPHNVVLKAIDMFGRERIMGIVLNGVAPLPHDSEYAKYYAPPTPIDPS
jgi:receptor protein-tyrosine kinase